MSASVSDIAQVTADDFLRSVGSALPAALGRDLATAIELALLTAVRDERRACAAACDRRAELWEKSAERADNPAPLRHQAQFRANEARYLADVIRTR